VLQRFLLRFFFLLGARFNITSLISFGRDMSEHNGVRASAVQGVGGAKLFIGRKFLTSACKVITFIYINPTLPYPNALDTVNYYIHRILVFRKAEGGET
jgi:hypothetical protein